MPADTAQVTLVSQDVSQMGPGFEMTLPIDTNVAILPEKCNRKTSSSVDHVINIRGQSLTETVEELGETLSLEKAIVSLEHPELSAVSKSSNIPSEYLQSHREKLSRARPPLYWRPLYPTLESRGH